MDSTPVEYARSRETVKRSDLVGWGNYGYCRSHSRFYWRSKLHLVCSPAGLPVTRALVNPEDRRTAGPGPPWRKASSVTGTSRRN
ncbi:hypothetical protein ACH0CM_25445 [Streptomyces albus]|nr:hypothetical protein [Streptomyces albus]